MFNFVPGLMEFEMTTLEQNTLLILCKNDFV